jgi:hypothetical protein
MRINACVTLFLETKIKYLPLEEDLFRDPSRKHPEIRSGITAGEVVAASYLKVCFLHKCRPDEFWVPPIDHEKGTGRLGDRQTIVDDNLTEAAVEVETEYVLSILGCNRPASVVVEWVYYSW